MKVQHIKWIGLLTAAAWLVILPAVGFGEEYNWHSLSGPADTLSLPPCEPSCVILYPWTYDNVALLESYFVEQSEMSIAVNPNVDSILMAGANTVSGPVASRTFNQGTYWSFNESLSWTGNNDAPPTELAGWDPTVGIAGMKYWFTYVHIGTEGTKVRVARGNTPGNWPNSWTVPNTAQPDKPHMAVDGVYGGPYVAYVEYVGYPNAAPKKIDFSKFDSAAGVMTFPITLSPPVEPGSPRRFQGPNVAVGSSGYVYVAWAVYDSGMGDESVGIKHETSFGFARLTNSGTTIDLRLDSIPGLAVRGILGPLKPGQISVNSFPSMAVARSGNWYGSIYIVWADRRSPDSTPDIYLTRSRDLGANWSAPICVNDEGWGTDQWMP